MSPMSPRLLRPRATGFSPKQIANLSAWWDASDSATLFDATSGGSLVAANGTVARWEDKSGNANHLTQSVANNRPLRNVSQFKGLDALDFDGSNDFLFASSVVPMINGASVVVVSQKQTNNSGSLYSMRGHTSANHHPFSDGNAYDSFASTARFSFAQSYRSDLYVWAVIAGSVWTAYAGQTVLLSTSYTPANQNGAPYQVIGAGRYDGVSATFFYDGLICEAIVYTRGISASEYASLYKYLKTKWGAA